MNAVSIVGLYFAFIGFLSGIFFTRLDSWYSDVRSKRGIISPDTSRDTYIKLEEPFISLKSSSPLYSFIAIGIFVSGLAILSAFIPIENAGFNPILFLYMPVTVTVLGFWLGGAFLLKRGSDGINDALAKIDDAKKGHKITFP